MSLKELSDFWLTVESWLSDSDDCCHTFVENQGMKHLILTLTFCSSYEVNKSIVKIIGYVASTNNLMQALQRQDALNYLELIACYRIDSTCYRDQEVCDHSPYFIKDVAVCAIRLDKIVELVVGAIRVN